MIRPTVTKHQVLQQGQEGQRVLDGEIPIQPFFQGTTESLHQAGISVSTGGEMENVFRLHQDLELLVVKFFLIVHLRILKSTNKTTKQEPALGKVQQSLDDLDNQGCQRSHYKVQRKNDTSNTLKNGKSFESNKDLAFKLGRGS